MTRLFEELGFVDVFRTLNPHPEQYTWWSNRGQAWAKNVGWRLDYHLATPGVAALARARAHLPREALLRPRAARHRLRTSRYEATTLTSFAASRGGHGALGAARRAPTHHSPGPP